MVDSRQLFVRILEGHEKGVNTVQFAHNSYDLLTASEDEGNVLIWRCRNEFMDCQSTTLHGELGR